jgi:hypothetical protein
LEGFPHYSGLHIQNVQASPPRRTPQINKKINKISFLLTSGPQFYAFGKTISQTFVSASPLSIVNIDPHIKYYKNNKIQYNNILAILLHVNDHDQLIRDPFDLENHHGIIVS